MMVSQSSPDMSVPEKRPHQFRGDAICRTWKSLTLDHAVGDGDVLGMVLVVVHSEGLLRDLRLESCKSNGTNSAEPTRSFDHE
eukprot:3345073-Rhodomonas_salina.1